MNELLILANDLRNCAKELDECILLTGRKQLTKIVTIRDALNRSADVLDANDLPWETRETPDDPDDGQPNTLAI